MTRFFLSALVLFSARPVPAQQPALEPAAVFNNEYRKQHLGKTYVEVPEVYELVNIAIALTRTATADRGLVYQQGPYYSSMRKWFAPHANHRAVALLDSALRVNRNSYFTLKMNGYAFVFDERGRIVRSPVYNRTGFTTDRSNSLLPYIDELEAFARVARFREFYRTQRWRYQRQIAFYRDTANIAEMKNWLERNFPAHPSYHSYRIIFSPLVSFNQSVTAFSSNGFRELQPHINFPYTGELRRFGLQALSPRSARLFRGNIAFSEINHGYLNPEAARYAHRISSAVSNRNVWVASNMGPHYYPGSAAFIEYMNWALVSLRIADHAPRWEQPYMLAAVDRMMTVRGFPEFPAFIQFLVPLYRNRQRQTLADLFPQIVQWFETRNSGAVQTVEAGPGIMRTGP